MYIHVIWCWMSRNFNVVRFVAILPRISCSLVRDKTQLFISMLPLPLCHRMFLTTGKFLEVYIECFWEYSLVSLSCVTLSSKYHQKWRFFLSKLCSSFISIFLSISLRHDMTRHWRMWHIFVEWIACVKPEFVDFILFFTCRRQKYILHPDPPPLPSCQKTFLARFFGIDMVCVWKFTSSPLFHDFLWVDLVSLCTFLSSWPFSLLKSLPFDSLNQ